MFSSILSYFAGNDRKTEVGLFIQFLHWLTNRRRLFILFPNMCLAGPGRKQRLDCLSYILARVTKLASIVYSFPKYMFGWNRSLNGLFYSCDCREIEYVFGRC